MRPWLSSLSLISLLSFACDKAPAPEAKQAEAAPAAAPSDAAKPADSKAADAAKQPAEPATRKPAPAKPTLDEATKLRKRLLALLNEGRTLTKNGDYAGGIAKYREALEIDQSDVSVLGELGWAAFRSGDLELAHRTTVQALKFVRDDNNKRGMLLYNLGRIEEDRDNIGDALDHYRDSLAARPNETVEARLAALEAKANQMAVAGSAGGELEGPNGLAAAAGLEVLGRDLADLAAACKLIETERCEDYTMDPDEPCACAPELLAAPGADRSWGLVKLGEDGTNMQTAYFPVVQTDKGWTAFAEALYVYNPGAFGIYEEAELLPSSVEPLLGTGTQLVMKFKKMRTDSDMGVNEIEGEDFEALVICARHGTGAYCTDTLLTAYSFSRDILFEGEDAEMSDEPIEHTLVPKTGFRAEVEFDDGKLIVTWAEVHNNFDRQGELWGAFAWVLPAGEHLLTQLLGMRG